VKKWEAPKLIVLVRGKPEESVLDTCKTTSYSIGPLVTYTFCWLEDIGCGVCHDNIDT